MTTLAERDLQATWVAGVERFGRERADAYESHLVARFDRLCDHPGLGPRWQGDVRCLVAGRHAIFYRVDDDRISILRVLHASMDAPAHLDTPAH